MIRSALTGPDQWKFWASFLLMPVNWGLEARKWQLVIRNLQIVSFWNALKATFTGVTIASFTPNRIGEYFGRMLYIDEGKRMSSVSLTILSSLSQFLVTLFAGLTGLVYAYRNLTSILIIHPAMRIGIQVLFFGSILAILGITVIYFRLSALVRFLGKTSAAKFLNPLMVLKNLDLTILFHLLSLSFLRYVVFILQYYLMFSLFGVSLTLGETFAGMSIMFLVMAVVPTFTFLTDLGLRWEASIQIIELFNPNTTGIFAVSLGIWTINLIIPALIGSLLILRIKLFKGR